MGVKDLWQFVHYKGYFAETFGTVSAAVAHGDAAPSRVLVDLQAAFFGKIRYAYSHHQSTAAHQMLQRAILKAGLTAESATLYVDGAVPVEKMATHQERAKKGRDSRIQAKEHLVALQERVRENKAVHKHHFQAVIKHALNGFRWPREERAAFVQYMRDQGWNVVECQFEADVTIARDSTENDVVLSIDSDYFAYSTVHTIVRPFRGKFRKYRVAEVLGHLELSRDQLTALCVVSQNDYTSNITQLGPKTNMKIIRKLRIHG